MLKRCAYLLIFLLCGGMMTAQLRVIKPIVTHPKKSTLAFGAGASRSVVYLNRNINDNNDATGYHVDVLYGLTPLIRGSLEYTFYNKINIAPTWFNVRAHTIEGNVHFLAHFKSKKAVFYPIFGLSYNIFSGYFTGVNDYLLLNKIYEKNHQATTRWLGLNVGTGFEFYFKPVSFFIDYKMRLGITQGTQQLNIMDVCFSAGLRFNLRVPSFYTIYKGTRGRYFLDTEDDNW